MNTNALKNFAQEARRKLMEQVASKMEFVLTTDSPALREKAEQVNKLREAIKETSKEQVIGKVTYTWFNRFIALRFMDANDYQPIGIRVLTPKNGFTLPELLDEAKQGHVPDELSVKKQLIYDLLDGKIPSSNGQNEAYKVLLIGACNHLNNVFPFLFERINDYTELLLPDDLTSELSIVQDVLEGMSNEDCAEVEIIGWLYQFYISEKKEELINAKKVYKADEIPPVTQLFTPKWIVEYMVDNTLGQYWKEARPDTKILKSLQFYIEPNNPELIPKRNIQRPEDIKFFDPCVGSAHVLCYAFDIFYKIYEEEGYDITVIPELIISKNLYGVDIDDRAAQLAGFALMMKGRTRNRRFFRKEIMPNITAFQNILNHPKFENAKIHGSLIKVSQKEADDIVIEENSLFKDRDIQLKKQAKLLANKYDIVVTNPPYLNSAYMNDVLKEFVDMEYKFTKSDLFACFLIQSRNLVNDGGLIGFICPYVWMFIKSFDELRVFVIRHTTIASLIQLEYNAFGPAVVPVGTFILRAKNIPKYKGTYIKLSNFKGIDVQMPKTLEAIKFPEVNFRFAKEQSEFNKIPNSIIGYDLSQIAISHFHSKKIKDYAEVNEGLKTRKNDLFIRFWWEINKIDLCKNWVFYAKGGGKQFWYGNSWYVLKWHKQGKELKDFKNASGTNFTKYRIPAITYSTLGNAGFSARYIVDSFFGGGGGGIIAKDPNKTKYILSLLNSAVGKFYINNLSQTLNFEVGDVSSIPVVLIESETINKLGDSCLAIVTEATTMSENIYQNSQNDICRIKGQDLEEVYELYQQYWKNKFFKLHRNEEELNRNFIEIYGLQGEVTPNVPLEDITILKEETTIENDQLVFHADEVFAQFMSYAVGCMFGRYGLDREGLILANQGETLEDYVTKVGKLEKELVFVPDKDNIIPVLDDEWFEDDIVGSFYAFLKASFGTANFDKNLAFVEECLGKDIRKYFVKDFYSDHIKRYKKRPIYWMFSSPKSSFNVLIYMHRYTPDTLNKIMNNYLIEYREKLSVRIEHLDHLIVSGTSAEQTRAIKEKDKIKLVLLELQEYEREILRPLAIERIKIDLDEGVLVNYNKFGNAIKEVAGLNDKVTKKKVREFDWINIEDIR